MERRLRRSVLLDAALPKTRRPETAARTFLVQAQAGEEHGPVSGIRGGEDQRTAVLRGAAGGQPPAVSPDHHDRPDIDGRQHSAAAQHRRRLRLGPHLMAFYVVPSACSEATAAHRHWWLVRPALRQSASGRRETGRQQQKQGKRPSSASPLVRRGRALLQGVPADQEGHRRQGHHCQPLVPEVPTEFPVAGRHVQPDPEQQGGQRHDIEAQHPISLGPVRSGHHAVSLSLSSSCVIYLTVHEGRNRRSAHRPFRSSVDLF
jgi:hypothetical protein